MAAFGTPAEFGIDPRSAPWRSKQGRDERRPIRVLTACGASNKRQLGMSTESSSDDGGAEPAFGVVSETDDFIDVTVGVAEWTTSNGLFIAEEDYRVSGEVWRVHKGDADPYPSKPHAHCIGGAQRFVGRKLHLGTAELFDGRRALGRFLYRKQFDALIELIRPKFPGVTLPLP
jgi:hypothetical protein